MPARSSCRRCSRPASATSATARRRCSASRSASRRCAGCASSRRTLAHKAGFHPTAVFGAMGAAAGVGAALQARRAAARRCARQRRLDGRAASSNIWPKAPGPSGCTPAGRRKSGIRAALLARAGFSGPRTVFEGVHGFFHAFAHTTAGDYAALTDGFGTRWVTQTLAFKPYPCGTMTHPYIDCARRLGARGIAPDDVVEMVCDVGEGTVHRLWEPLAAKQRPANGYAGKFSTPYCIAAGFRPRQCGLERFLRRRGARRCGARARRQGALPHRSEKSLSEQFHRPHPRHAARRLRRSRSASRTCAAARTSRSRAPTSRRNFCSMPARRLERRSRRRGDQADRRPVRWPARSVAAAGIGAPFFPSALAGEGGALRAYASNGPGEGSCNSTLRPLTRFARNRSRSTLSHKGRGKISSHCPIDNCH